MSNRHQRPLSRLIALAIVGGIFAAPVPADPLRIEARDGAAVRLPNVTNITPQRGSPIEIVAEGAGSQVELPALTSFYGGSTGAGSYLQASTGGHLVLNATLLQLSGGTELRLTETGTCTLGGLRLDTGALLSGSGFLGTSLVNNGRVSPGNGAGSAGGIHIGGTYQQGAEGVLAIELGGPAPGDQFDRLVIDQGAQLGGTLAVSGFAGFIPAAGSTLPFIASAVRTGQFAQATGLQWESGGTLALSYSATGAALSAQGGGFADGTGPTLDAFLFNGTALVDGAVLTGPGELSLTATDLSGIDRIEVQAGAIHLATAPGGTGQVRALLPIGALADGPQTLEIRGFDTAGNETLVQFAIQVALQPPPAPTLSAPADGSATIAPTVAVAGSAAVGAEVILYRNDAPVAGPLAVDASGGFSATIDLLLGVNRLQAEARNRAGTSPRGREVVVTRHSPVALQVTAVEIPSIGSQGKPVQVAWQVRNAGETAAQGPWTDHVILSANAVLGDADDQYLGAAGFPAGESVAPGASYDRVLNYVLPSNLPDGNYWIAAAADVENRVGAPGAGKQRISDRPIAVSPHGPDLIVTEVIAPVDGVLSGSTTEVSFVVTNVGDRPADRSTWKDAIYLSADTELNAGLENEDLRGTFDNVRTLQPGEQYRQTVAIRLPEDQIGTFYVAAIGDGSHHLAFPAEVQETDESNNVTFSPAFRIDPAPQPDLVATTIRFQPGTIASGGATPNSARSAAVAASGAMAFQPTPIFSGQLLAVTWTTENQGDGPTDGFTDRGVFYPNVSHWRSEVYLSPTNDPSVDPARDIFLTHQERAGFALGPHASEAVTNIQKQVPVDLHGPYYIKVRLDTLDQVSELGGESNNIAVSPVPVEVILSVPVDLVPTAISGPALGIPGHLARVTWSAENAGPRGDFPLGWKDAVYLSLDETLDASDIRLGEAAMASPGNSGAGGADTLGFLPPYTRSLDFRVPNDTPAGTYRLLISADDANDIFELPEGEANNTLASTAPIEVQRLPTDLTPQADVDPDHPLPKSGAPGTTIDIAWQVTNTGTVATPVAAWRDQVLLSPTPTRDGRPLIQLGESRHNGALAPGADYPLSHSATLPYIAPGDYYLLFSTDSENAVYEQAPGEDNNLLAVPFRMTSEVADLAVKQVTAPAAGNTVQVEWTVVNDGARPTSAAAWVDDVYLSRDRTLDNADIHLGSREHTDTEVLAPGAGYTVNATFQLPIQDSGLYYLIVKTDSLVDVFETELANNLAVVPLPVNVQPADLPNLRPSGLAAPAQVYGGQTLHLAWTERNLGGGTTDEARWPGSVFLSRDRYLDRSGDIYLGEVEVDQALAPGESVAFSKDFRVPTGLTGPYHPLVYADRDNVVFEGNETDNLLIGPHSVEVVAPPISDLVVGDITPPETGTAGEDATFRWEIINAGTEPVVGSWEDSIYLSADDQWDIEDTRVGSFQVPPVNLQPGQSTTVTVTAPIPGVLPGDYHVIVRTDIYNQMPEQDESDNVGASASSLSIEMVELRLGETLVLEGAREPRYFALRTAADDTVEIVLEADDNITLTTTLLVSRERVPTLAAFDFIGESPSTGQRTLKIPQTETGVYYVLVYPGTGFLGAATSPRMRISAQVQPLSLSDFPPKAVGAGKVTFTASGAGWRPETTGFFLRDKTSGVDLPIAPEFTFFDSATRAKVSFDLSGMTGRQFLIGLRDRGREITGGTISVVPAVRDFALDFPPDPSFRSGVSGQLIFTARNTGNVDLDFLDIGLFMGSGENANLIGVSANTPYLATDATTEGDRAWIGFRRLAPEETQAIALSVMPLAVGDSYLDAIAIQYGPEELLVALGAWRDELRSVLLVDPDCLGTSDPSDEACAAARDEQSWQAYFDKMLQDAEYFGPIKSSYRDYTKQERQEYASRIAALASGNAVLGMAGPVTVATAGSASCAQECRTEIRKWCKLFTSVPGAPKPMKRGIHGPVSRLICEDVARVICNTSCSVQDALDPAIREVEKVVKKAKRKAKSLAAGDPNEKFGPAGSGDTGYVVAGETMRYRITFENVPTATAPAATVSVFDRLDSSLDLTSARIADIEIAGTRISVPPGRSFFSNSFYLPAGTDQRVQLTAGIDALSRKVIWQLDTIDPTTGEKPTNPEAGFLLPDDGSGRGQGWVEFTVKVGASVPPETVITNNATIVFDVNEPILTNNWTNVVAAPTAPVTPATITVTPVTQRNTTEGGVAARFEVVLDQAPTADVTVPLASSDPTEGTVTPAQLVFTPANWNTRQSATVTGVNDCAPDGDVAYQVQVGPATSTDTAYNGLAPTSLAYTNLDNDPPSTHPTLSVCNYALVSTARYGRFDYDYSYRVQLTNSGAAAGNVTATLSSLAAKTRVIDGAVAFGPVASDATVQSQDTFTIRQDRQTPFDPASLRWGFQTTP